MLLQQVDCAWQWHHGKALHLCQSLAGASCRRECQSCYENLLSAMVRITGGAIDWLSVARHLAELVASVEADITGSRQNLRLAVGAFTEAGGTLATTCSVAAYRYWPGPVHPLKPDTLHPFENDLDLSMRVLTLECADALNVVALPAMTDLLPTDAVERSLRDVPDRRVALQRLSNWISESDCSTPALLIGIGTASGIGAAQTAIAVSGEHSQPHELAQQCIEPATLRLNRLQQAVEALDDKLDVLCSATDNTDSATRLLTRVIEHHDQLQAFLSDSVGDTHQRLIKRLEELETDQVDQQVTLPLCRYLMSIHDTIEDALTGGSDHNGVLGALAEQVLVGLALHGIEPFRENGEFDPRTQDMCSSQGDYNGDCELRSLRCGFRRDGKIVRREKVIFERIRFSNRT